MKTPAFMFLSLLRHSENSTKSHSASETIGTFISGNISKETISSKLPTKQKLPEIYI